MPSAGEDVGAHSGDREAQLIAFDGERSRFDQVVAHARELFRRATELVGDGAGGRGSCGGGDGREGRQIALLGWARRAPAGGVERRLTRLGLSNASRIV